MTELVCPKCQSPLRSYERGGVTVDQCTNCRGIFLDRGELERLIEAKNTYYSAERDRPGGGRRDRDDDDNDGPWMVSWEACLEANGYPMTPGLSIRGELPSSPTPTRPYVKSSGEREPTRCAF